ncbi:MAG: tRNA lysidine(34) synthetase TilS [Bacillota bacterium]|nr:tRNA lysidine(34) synthetase TilS [Bacillota bacterium]
MLQKGDRVIVAVSGGPDSMCLIHILHSLKDRYDITLYAAHVNHCLRGEDSDGDEEYVRNFCIENSIEFFSKRVDIGALSRELNLSSETAGREARYDFFKELRSGLGAQKVALAHNLNDQAETMLMRIMRGTGLEGLYGIKPVRDNIYIRPILILAREEIEAYCERYGIKPRIDKSNYESIYNRNKIRLELIPYIRENFNKDIVNTLSRLSYIIGRDNDFIEEAAEKRYYELCREEPGRVILNKAISGEKEAITSRILRHAIKYVRGNLKNIEMVHINDIISLFTIGTGKRINLPGGIVCENVYGDIRIFKSDNLKQESFVDNITIFQKDKDILLPSVCFIDAMGLSVSMRLIDREEVTDFGEEGSKRYFDYDTVKNSISLRYRREGDRIVPCGMRGSKKLKDVFMDLKLPKEERDKVPIICFDDEIAWVFGYRVSNNHIVTKKTKNIIEIKIEKGEN